MREDIIESVIIFDALMRMDMDACFRERDDALGFRDC